MIRCEDFARTGANAQPFSVRSLLSHARLLISALVVADCHAHLCNEEIIGFLGGSWDPEGRLLTVSRSFPCRSLPLPDSETNVEMDPQSAVEVKEAIEREGMRVVGWYHSHPLFQPDPSVRDVENQQQHQHHARGGLT